jgi:hypothetical protein
MTLGEFAKNIAEEIAGCAEWRSDVRAVIGSAAELLYDLPAAQMRWFWQEVADELTARRPIEQGEQAEQITAAISAVQEALAARA